MFHGILGNRQVSQFCDKTSKMEKRTNGKLIDVSSFVKFSFTYRAFLSSPGVDPKLINEQWIGNHYKWIVWKLASYEVSYPDLFFGR